MKLRVTCTGKTPLLMHNVQLASPLNPYAQKLKELSSKRSKTIDDHWEIARVEWEGGMYYASQPIPGTDQPIGPFVPGENITAALIDGARITRAGKKIERGVTTDGYMFPLLYDGPRDLESMWNDGRSDFVDMRSVSVYGRKIDRCRPRFINWVLEAVMLIDERVIDEREFQEVARLTGEMEGLGDFRRVFGKFDARVEVIG